MHTENLYRQIRGSIASQKFDELQAMKITKPEKFNWVTEVFENIHVKDRPEAPALIWTDGREIKEFTFRELSTRCNRILFFLRENGLQQNAVIFSQMPLFPANWLTVLVSIKGGFRLVPSAISLNVNDIVYRFNRLFPGAVIADADNAVKIEEAERVLDKIIPLKIIVGGAKTGWTSFSTIEEQEEEKNAIAAADTRADDPLFLFFTSGTTGMPKVVIQTHFSYPFGHLSTAAWAGIRQTDIHYNISQPGWAKFAYSSFFAPWNIGAAVFAFYQTGRFNAADQLRMIEKFKVTTFCAPPTALRMLILEKLDSYSFSLRECVSAGEPLNPEIIETWKKGTGLTIRDGFGQTENTILVANLPGEKIKFGSMGKPTFMYDIVIADEDGNELPANEEGNITIKTGTGRPNGLFTGYFGDPGKEKEVFRHGLYYTGDKAYKDADGYIWFVGRDDDVIKSSDYRVGPFEVESVLLEHEMVVESAVVGSPHPIKGLVVKAFIILTEGTAPNRENADDIFAYARKNLAPYKTPRIIEFVTELPKTISGKIRRVELRAGEALKSSGQLKRMHEYHSV
ncbi:MAG TPA: AMP-binding protein [Puia sp.]|nr:AMP-binding protein [Puia sp.]